MKITAAITAVGGYVPETVLTNFDLEKMNWVFSFQAFGCLWLLLRFSQWCTFEGIRFNNLTKLHYSIIQLDNSIFLIEKKYEPPTKIHDKTEC